MKGCWPCRRRNPERTDTARFITLYAVRHGEAFHNIREKEAKRKAEARLRESDREGTSPQEVHAAQEAHPKGVAALVLGVCRRQCR